MPEEEKEVLQTQPNYFRQQPIWIIFWVIAIYVGLSSAISSPPWTKGIVFGVLGMLALLFNAIEPVTTTLIVTTKRTTVKKFSNSRSILHVDVSDVAVRQGPLNKLFGVGRVEISSALHGGVEIAVSGIEDPERIRRLIDKYRDTSSSGVG